MLMLQKIMTSYIKNVHFCQAEELAPSCTKVSPNTHTLLGSVFLLCFIVSLYGYVEQYWAQKVKTPNDG